MSNNPKLVKIDSKIIRDLRKKINKILNDVNLIKYINKLPNKHNTKVGERGSNFSVGQIQRIGIARALYKEREILIFDEATNALDKENEEKIIKMLNQLEKRTIIMVSHNKNILSCCDQIFKVEEGKLKKI